MGGGSLGPSNVMWGAGGPGLRLYPPVEKHSGMLTSGIAVPMHGRSTSTLTWVSRVADIRGTWPQGVSL